MKAFKRRNGRFILSKLLDFEILDLNQIEYAQTNGDDKKHKHV